ncbi:Phosphatidylinositolglycan class N-domain-containing protein [Tuber borchii]|uniref:GPI ethanolamine phosphate transferase 1 n=1 Tax=Tuber borchii TaxID=42251 RepID=A0A2T6ZIG4_TUBBO|nr:Phosphatidylinositolglycan class N-domain-containing protein [Tuber borchii]
MARLGRLGFLGLAVLFHLIYIYSIFDIYFVSPIVHGMQQYRVDAPAPAKRLFLIVGDGLRADKCFQSHDDPDYPSENRYLAPFIRSKVLNDATFGVSHTRVPTESRPGHVALIAGLYEDVSAVTTGWKLNPVNFDSVFNESRHTWSWGSPDILPMFKHGANDESRVDAFSYDEEMEDFTADSIDLDIWVFDRVRELFESAAHNDSLNAMLRQDKVVFFLHLLGLDTAGHSYRPYSAEYLRNIKVVDEGVQQIHKLVNDFYGNDDKTAWIFTADHGMSDWGSHGDGHPDNTRTPLVAWGAGIKKPVASKVLEVTGHEDGFSGDWGLGAVRRVDVAQADVAALMAYLVGLNFPVNSVGELPLEYLDANASVKAEASLANARQILEMYKVKEEQKKSTTLRYTAFVPLSEGEQSLESRFVEIRGLIDNGSHERAIEKCVELIKVGLEGLRYLQTYDWLFLRSLVTAGYLGWIAFSLTTVIDLHVLHGRTEPTRTRWSSIFFISGLVAIYSILMIQKSSWTYYAYAFFPAMFWEEVYARKNSTAEGIRRLVAHLDTWSAYMGLGAKMVGFLVLLEAMVYGYFRREVFTGCFLLATIWPLLYGPGFLRKNKLLAASWMVCCSLMSTFTLLPAIKQESENLILLGGFFMFSLGLLYMMFGETIVNGGDGAQVARSQDWVSKSILGLQLGLIGLSMFVTRSSVRSLQAKLGLPLGNQAVGWLVLVFSIACPFLHGIRPQSHYFHRLVVIFLTFSPIFVILTISYEGLFYVMFCLTLVAWVRLEHKIHLHSYRKLPKSPRSREGEMKDASSGPDETLKKNSTASTAGPHAPCPQAWRELTLADARIALFFFFLIQVAFFGTGNVASVSSFSLDSVYRLIPMFNPFAMGALLVLKLMIPFAVISANLGILNRRIGVAPSSLFMIVMAISDVLTLNFFYMVRDEGSWLDIGTTISHFCISSMLGVFVSALEFVSEVFVGGLEWRTGTPCPPPLLP